MKDNTLTIRCTTQFYNLLGVNCSKYNVSQSKLLEILLYSFNDYKLVDPDNKMVKYIEKMLSRK